MHAARLLSLALASAMTLACASPGAIGAGADGTRRPVVRRSANVISAHEIAQERASSAYELVERLRPYYLRGRSAGFFSLGPIVYMDDVMLGGIEHLRTIHALDVLEIRYRKGEEMFVRQQEASGHQVIQVVTKRR